MAENVCRDFAPPAPQPLRKLGYDEKSTDCTLCLEEDETARNRIGHPPSHVETNTMKSLTLQNQLSICCLRTCKRNCTYILFLLRGILNYYRTRIAYYPKYALGLGVA